MKKKMKPTRYYSSKQEKSVARNCRGKVTANSGATKWSKGDVTLADFLIECKTTTTPKKSFSIKKEWLDKNEEEAFAMRKHHSALAFQFEEGGDNYYIISERDFKEYLELLKG